MIPGSEANWSITALSHLAWSGLMLEILKLMSILSMLFPASSAVVTFSEYHVEKQTFSFSLKTLLTAKSKGWSSPVQEAGMNTKDVVRSQLIQYSFAVMSSKYIKQGQSRLTCRQIKSLACCSNIQDYHSIIVLEH